MHEDQRRVRHRILSILRLRYAGRSEPPIVSELEFIRLTVNHGEFGKKLKDLGQRSACDGVARNALFIALCWMGLALDHIEDAKLSLANHRKRATYSRAYYAAYNASKCIRYLVIGRVSLAGDDHRRASELPAACLQTLLTRSTRAVAGDASEGTFSVPYVPFQNQEDYQLAQPASHVVVGRRGVGKSTLIKRAAEIIRGNTSSIVAIIDAQAYSLLSGESLKRELLYDVLAHLVVDIRRVAALLELEISTASLDQLSDDLIQERITPEAAATRTKRYLSEITRAIKGDVFVFLDDFHLIEYASQPNALHLLHAALKGANGWLKVAGLRSLINYYSATERIGMQVPGDAQLIPLDLTLENPDRAESHLRAILEGFLKAVGYSLTGSVLPSAAFKRLAWANAGVPRDFLQMFGRAIHHARKNRHSVVTLSDVNASIGESGQTKMDELEQDARNSQGELVTFLSELETLCLEKKHINAFLVRSENSRERHLVHVLSDLRLVHLINQSITPDKAGQRYEAYIMDYSLFTGFRRRPGVREMVPDEGEQFRAADLRKLPKVPASATP